MLSSHTRLTHTTHTACLMPQPWNVNGKESVNGMNAAEGGGGEGGRERETEFQMENKAPGLERREVKPPKSCHTPACPPHLFCPPVCRRLSSFLFFKSSPFHNIITTHLGRRGAYMLQADNG